jgi:hypothetical protein
MILSLKNDVNVPSKSNKLKKLEEKIIYFWHLEITDEKDPDPQVSGTYSRIRSVTH